MRDRKIHCVYRITNKLNGKFYIGKHSTDDVDDGYMGSGVAIRRAVAKHGKCNFSKEILSTHETEELAYEEESRVLEGCESDRLCYNMVAGGTGFPDGHEMTEDVRQKISQAMKGKKKPERARKNMRFNGEAGWQQFKKKVRQFDLSGNQIAIFESASAAARSLDRLPSCITSCARGVRKTAYGYRWEYVKL